jgi:hypothetical protein
MLHISHFVGSEVEFVNRHYNSGGCKIVVSVHFGPTKTTRMCVELHHEAGMDGFVEHYGKWKVPG